MFVSLINGNFPTKIGMDILKDCFKLSKLACIILIRDCVIP